MTEIKLNKEGIKRMDAFSGFLKKTEKLLPVQNDSLFSVSKAARTITCYANGNSMSGGNGMCRIIVDASVEPTGDDEFTMNLETLVKALKKVRGDEANLKVNKNSIVISGAAGAKSSITLTTLPNPNAKSKYEMVHHFEEHDGLFLDSIRIDLKPENKEKLQCLMRMNDIQGTNNNVEVDSDVIRFADNMCVIEMKLERNSICDQKVLLDSDFHEVLKHMTSLRVSQDGKSYWVEFGPLGIEMMAHKKDPRWCFPTEDEIGMIKPDQGKFKNQAIQTEALLESLEKFDGMFDSAKRKYDEVRVSVGQQSEVELHFQDFSCEVREVIASSAPQGLDSSEYEFCSPFLYVSKIQQLLGKEIILTSNSLTPDEDHGKAVVMESGDLTILLAKMIFEE